MSRDTNKEFPHTQSNDKSGNSSVSAQSEKSIWLPGKDTVLECSGTDKESSLNETEKALDTTLEKVFMGSLRPSIHIQKDSDNLFDPCPRMLEVASGPSFTIHNFNTSLHYAQ